MKLKEWEKTLGLKTEADILKYYKDNHIGIYFCNKCDEIINDTTKGCPICNKSHKLASKSIEK